MRLDCWSIVPIVLGVILLAAWAADGHELLTSTRNDDWWLVTRSEFAYLGGLWLLCGLAPRWARTSAIGVFGSVLIYDLARVVLSYPLRHSFAQVAVGPWWVLGSDLIILLALWRWRPAAGRVAWIVSHPGRIVGTALIAAALGVAIDRSQVGRFPIVAAARSGGSSSSPGPDYLVYLPAGYYNLPGYWPLILDLHGAGEVGRGIDRIRSRGLPGRIEAGARLPFLVIAPQCPRQSWDAQVLDALLEEVLAKYRVDAERVYLTGVSMGGYGAWALAAAHPERFAAIAPICGGGDPAWADRLRGVPTWAFHGADDTVVPHEESRRMVAALERAGGDVRLTTYPGIGHGAATPTYADRRLYDWFLAHRRRAGESGVEAATPPWPDP
jgi:poly(3-hydroxybutyrate) depolymerase